MVSNWIFAAACLFALFVCMCRLTKMNDSTKPVILARYTVWGTVLFASGMCGLFGYFMIAAYLLAGAFLADLTLSLGAWRHSQPDHAVK